MREEESGNKRNKTMDVQEEVGTAMAGGGRVPVTEAQVVQGLAKLQQRATQLEVALQQQQAAAQARTVGVKAQKPDTYYGGRDPAKVERWGYQIRQFVQLQGVAGQFQVTLASTYLKSSAYTWWVERERAAAAGTLPAMTNMDEFVAALKLQFVPLEGKHVAQEPSG